jgi:hypothetical protein
MGWNNESSDDIANELAGYQEDFNAAPMPEGGGMDAKVPDGSYQATIKRVDITRSKKNNKLLVRWRIKITGPILIGAELTKWNGFDDQEKLGYLKKDLAICGVQVTNLAKLEAQLVELDGKAVEVTVKTNGQYQNVYLNSSSPETPF